MKKIIAFILSTIFVLSSLLLTSCDFYCNDNKDNNDKVYVELNSDDGLIRSLIVYLEELYIDYDLTPASLAEQINYIKDGVQPLHVGFNSSDCYYVCGYYNEEHKCYGRPYVCCSTEYTWVKFENANEIIEEYNGLKLFVAFQVDIPAFVTDIVSNDGAAPNFEHFQMYEPTFENGVNTNGQIPFNEIFIYLSFPENSYKSSVYHATSAYQHDCVYRIKCISMDGQYYIKVPIYDTPSGELILVYDFREYYDVLMKIMNIEYTITHKDGTQSTYGLLDINEFVNKVFK